MSDERDNLTQIYWGRRSQLSHVGGDIACSVGFPRSEIQIQVVPAVLSCNNGGLKMSHVLCKRTSETTCPD